MVLVSPKALYLYQVSSGRNNPPLQKTILATEGDYIGFYQDQVRCFHQETSLIYVFVASGKLVILDEKYLHATKKIQFCKYSISTVHQVSARFFLVGSVNGTVEAIHIRLGEDISISSKIYFFSQRKVVAIKTFQSMISEEVFFGFRTDQNHIILAKTTDNYPLRIINIDNLTLDVTDI